MALLSNLKCWLRCLHSTIVLSLVLSSSLLSFDTDRENSQRLNNYNVSYLNSEPIPPVAKKVQHYNNYHGVNYLDEYHWLRDDKHKDAEVISHLEKENTYSDAILQSIEPLYETIYQEISNRTVDTHLSYSRTVGGYKYYTKKVKTLPHSIYCRKKINEGDPQPGTEEILLDLNTFNSKHLKLGSLNTSPDRRLLAYTLDTTGREVYEIFVKNIETGETTSEVRVAFENVYWSANSQYLFYISFGRTKKTTGVYRHKLGENRSSDVVLFEEGDRNIMLYLEKSFSKNYLFLTLDKYTTTEVHYIDIDKPLSNFTCFSPFIEGRRYSLEHNNNDFLILTNQHLGIKYINNHVLKTSTNRTTRSGSEDSWEAVIPYNEKHYIMVMYPLKNHLVFEERFGGYAQIRIIDYATSLENPEGRLIEHPEEVFESLVIQQYMEYSRPEIVYSYTSPLTPPSKYSYNLLDNSSKILEKESVSGNFNPQLYTTERIYADNDVPISLVYRKDMFHKDGSNPLHLYAYGSYGMNSEPDFRGEVFSLLDRGFIYAIAHVRGGSELGRQWYEVEGRLLNKKNTIRDFTAAAKHLIELNYTSSKVLSISGGSAGGLLMGAVINQNPDLYSAAIADVAFFDLVNILMDPSLPITILNYPEWGNPNIKEHFEYMMSYSPYNNLPDEPKKFPHMLITSGYNDIRVPYWSPAKHVAKIRDILSKPESSNDTKILQVISMNSGHSLDTGTINYNKRKARDYAFLVASAQNLYPFQKIE